MSALRLTLHVLLAGLYVFLTTLTVVALWKGSDGTIVGMVVMTLVGAWAGASSMVRTLPSLVAAGGGIGALALLAFAGGVFSSYVSLFVLLVMVPLALALFAVVVWRAAAEPHEAPRATLHA